MSKSLKYAQNQLGRFDPKFMQIAIVMDNRDPLRSGRLKVWVLNSQSDKDSSDSWITASYLAPFAGRTPGRPGAGSYQQFPKGYGFWAVPPDVGTTVAVFFANGNIYDAWWFGGAYDERMNTMVPGSATQELPDSGYDMPVPVTDYDRNSLESNTEQKYVNVPLAEGLKKQNLLYDPDRGTANRSSTRQTTSTVYGLSSPRGSCFIIDDGYLDSELESPSWDDEPDQYQDTQFNNPVNDTRIGSRTNEGIILRTRSGAQFLLSESKGNVFLMNRDGTARFEMTPEGNILVHADKSISFRAGEDINLLAGRDINSESGRDYNCRVGNNTKLELVNTLDVKVGSNVVVNTGAELRLVSNSNIRVQSGESVNLVAGSTFNTTSSSTTNIKASDIKVSSSWTDFSISGTVDSSSIVKAPNFQTPSVGLNEHIHVHQMFINAENHSNEMSPPTKGSSQPSAKSASNALVANDVQVEIPTQNDVEEVQYINSTSEMSEIFEQDLMSDTEELTYGVTYEGLFMVMPCNGTIREFGYWGKNVKTQNGTTANRNGWLIQCKGAVLAPDAGLVTRITGGGVMITHLSGYKSIFYDLDVSVNNQTEVGKGDKIGIANGSLVFEVRIQTSNIFGFSGTVDPGLFYQKVTGLGEDCSNKSLTAGVQSNPDAKPVVISESSQNSSELVVISSVKSIGSGYAQRGSLNQPRRKQKKSRGTSNSPRTAEDLSTINRIPEDWRVEPTDPKLVNEIKEFEGTKEFQATRGYYRAGKFWTYSDSLGYPTIGYGHLIRPNESFRSGIDESTAEKILMRDLNSTVADAREIYARYNMKTPYIVQVVLTEMVFQLGKGGVLKFTNFLNALSKQKYALAAKEMRSSLWYRQTTRRVEILARRVEACQN